MDPKWFWLPPRRNHIIKWEEIILSSDVIENAQACGSSLSDILDASPIQYQIKQKRWRIKWEYHTTFERQVLLV